MYATAKEYLCLYKLPKPDTDIQFNNFENNFENKENYNRDYKENFENSENSENSENNTKTNTADPKVWGPPFWNTLHVSAAHYPMNPSPIVRERMKNRILAIPYEVPCHSCRIHASAFIEKNRDLLDEIVSNRHSLGKFYVDFHNAVNKRYGKPEWTYDQAYKKYSGSMRVTFL